MQPAAPRDIALSDRDFNRVRSLIHAHAGISLNDSKKQMAMSRLSRRLRERGIESFEEYLALVERDDGGEREQFVNSLTTNLTAFFRESHHFPVLADIVRRAVERNGEARVWCAAASTGEEPWSIAMTALDSLGASAGRVSVVASDIDTAVLATASAGIYPREAVEKVPYAQLSRYFLGGTGSNEGKVRVRDSLRAVVSFRRINLLDPKWPIDGQFDAIFCRNVMIYFDRPTQEKILERMAPMIAPEGRLFVGHSENLAHSRARFIACGRTVYARA